MEKNKHVKEEIPKLNHVFYIQSANKKYKLKKKKRSIKT